MTCKTFLLTSNLSCRHLLSMLATPSAFERGSMPRRASQLIMAIVEKSSRKSEPSPISCSSGFGKEEKHKYELVLKATFGSCTVYIGLEPMSWSSMLSFAT